MTRTRTLDEFPTVGIGWCHVPDVVEEHPNCDVADCGETPEFEIYFHPDPNHVWYYMCLTHKNHFAKREVVTA